MADLYILHFKSRYWSNARHYVGYTKFTAEERVAIHRSGKGSMLVRYALDKGIDFEIGHVEHFEESKSARWREIRLKHEGHLDRHCDICQSMKAKPSSTKIELPKPVQGRLLDVYTTIK